MSYRVFDGHCDTPAELWRNGWSLADNTCDVSLRRAEKLPGYLQYYAFCMPWMAKGSDKTNEELFAACHADFMEQLAANSDRITLCRSGSEAEAAVQNGKCGAMLCIEGAEAISCDPGKLEAAKAMGISMVTLTWNFENALSGSIMTGGGLTAQGKEFVREAQRLGILIDVSHLSEKGFWDLCDITEKPFIASHSNSRALCRHKRNLTDEQYQALCSFGGTAGLNVYSSFLNDAGTSTFEDVFLHFAHFLDLGGEGHIALGGDLDGCDNKPEGFDGVDGYNPMWDYLLSRGIPEKTLREIYSDSFLKVVKQCTT